MSHDTDQCSTAWASPREGMEQATCVVFGASAALIEAMEPRLGFAFNPLADVGSDISTSHVAIALDGGWQVERLLAEALRAVQAQSGPGVDCTIVLENAAGASATLIALVRSLAREAGQSAKPGRVNLIQAPRGTTAARLVDALAFLASGAAAFVSGAALLLDPGDAGAPVRSLAPILVTGASGGIGAACAAHLALAGHEVLVTGRDLDAAELVANDIVKAGGVATALALDATSASDWRRVVDRYGVLSGVVSNVGACRLGPTDRMSQADIDLLLAANIASHANALSIALPAVAVGGRMVFTGSVAALKAAPGNAVYSASKAAILDLIAGSAAKARARGVRLHSIHPGLVFNDNVRRTHGEAAAARLREQVVGATPLRRFAQASDIGSAIAALVKGELALDPTCALVCDGGFAA